MFPFAYAAASDAHAAREIARGRPDSRFLAGGTTLIDLMKLEVEHPSLVIDITPLPLTNIEELPDGTVRVGALVRNTDMAHHELIRTRYPMLSQAILAGASPQLRNMATTGGNLMQRTRCYYFRDTSAPCNKRMPGSGCSALEGYNRIHAVLGTSDQCIATHASDMCVARAALDATVRLTGPSGERTVHFAAFHLLPGDHPEHETVLEHGELITAVDLRPLPFARRSVYVKVRDRASYAFALASAAVALELSGGVIRQARVALGGIATRPWRAHEAELLLEGREASVEMYRQAADAALAAAIPRRHNAFKIELARRT